MKKLNTEIAKIILHELSHQPLGRTELEKRTIQKSGITHTVFENTFNCLIPDGYVKKTAPNLRAKYAITAKVWYC
ncbi:MAG: hypothetical protein LBQ98_06365 [Nitrososphaerota archaeon]|jgi:DNA-binding HxlR family transcriptional regulator|nr:hypothetical protein [Nitrososphaerota archaeon]